MISKGSLQLPTASGYAFRKDSRIVAKTNHLCDSSLTTITKHTFAATRADLEGTALRSNYYLALGAAGALLQFLEQVERNTLIACNIYSMQQ